MTWVNLETQGDILFGNAFIKQVLFDAAAGTLVLKAVCSEREYRSIEYGDVFYSQIDSSFAGHTILIAEELPLKEIANPAHRVSAAMLLADFGSGDLSFIDSLGRRKYRLFIHYAENMLEYMVVAKSFKAEGKR